VWLGKGFEIVIRRNIKMTTLQAILLGLTVANWVLIIGLYRLMGKLQGQFKRILEILTDNEQTKGGYMDTFQIG